MKGLIFLLVLAAVPAFAQSSVNKKIGLVSNIKIKSGCLEIANSRLKAGQRVTVVILDKPQSLRRTTIRSKLAKGCSDESGEGMSFYSLGLSKKLMPFDGIGVVGSRVSISRGVASADVNGDGRLDRFRSCTSNEGAWLSVWSGKPLVGKRLWHAYAYAGYDTVPDCKEKDYK